LKTVLYCWFVEILGYRIEQEARFYYRHLPVKCLCVCVCVCVCMCVCVISCDIKKFIIIIIIITTIITIIIYLPWSWATCWTVPVSRIQKSLQRFAIIPSAIWGIVFYYPGYSITGHSICKYTLSNKDPSAWNFLSRTGSDVRYSCHHNSSRFTFPIFAHSLRFSVFHSLQSITPLIY